MSYSTSPPASPLGEEAVGAIFDGEKSKCAEDAPAEGSKSKDPGKKQKWGKKGKKPQHDARAQGCGEDDDEALAVDPARKGRRGPPRGPGVFDEVNHTLEQCDMLKKYYSCVVVKEDEAKKDGGDGSANGFPAVENVFLIFGGLTVDMSTSQRKHEWHEVLAAKKAPPSFIDWSEEAITFSHEDHPYRILNPNQYPLVVDPVIGNSLFSRVMMDSGSSLNIMYAHILR
jgi:hypothetical protein